MSEIAEKKFPCAMLLGGLSVNLNHLKMHCKLSQLGGSIDLETLILYHP